MSIFLALIIGLTLSFLIIGTVSGYIHPSTLQAYFHKRVIRKKQIADEKMLKNLEEFKYPKYLTTKGDIELYIAKNSQKLPTDKDFPLPEMIERISKAGWNTEIPISCKIKYRRYNFYLDTTDKELSAKLYEIIHNYQERYEASKNYE